MPFNPDLNYNDPSINLPSHVAVPPAGRRVMTADYAVMYLGATPIGLVQRFAPSESRPVAAQFEIGNTYPVEFIPQPWQGQITVSRLEIFKNSLFKAFNFDKGISQYKLDQFWPSEKKVNNVPVVTSLADIQWPLDISIHIQNPNGIGAGDITVKNYIECWITQYGYNMDAGAKVVAENVTFVYRTTNYGTSGVLADIAALAAQL